MTTSAMDPPPPRNPSHDIEPPEPNTTSISQSDESSTMNPPPPRNPNPPDLKTTEVVVEPEPIEESKDDSVTVDADKPVRPRTVKQNPVPYTIPEWSGPPCHQFQLEVLKEGAIVEKLDVYKKGAYLFGRDGICDFALEHPSISRFHAVIQYKRSGAAYIFDLGSTHGTTVNKNKVDKKVFVDLNVGDVIRFGGSTRLYIFQGPSDLMPPEKDLQLIREAKMRMEMSEREASLRRARQQASMADGVSWGMGEDAIEEEEDDVEEITWQTYSGELTPKQEKTKEKVLKRLEKIGHMKKEVAAIRAKDISQGGLTQGQQTQIARNEQRTAELLEELENLEETLNDSIRESLGAKTGRKPTHGKKKGIVEDEEDLSSDEDDFYDRTQKKPSTKKGSENQTVETVDSLLDKRDNVLKEIEAKNEQLLTEKSKMETENVTEVTSGDSLDALDAYMTGLSTTLVQDKTAQIQQELSTLQSELSRILYLLKIADPTGEEVKKRELKSQELKIKKSETPSVEKKINIPLKQADPNEHKEKEVAKDLVDSENKPEVENKASETAEEKKTTVYVPSKPQWLGSAANKAIIEEKNPEIVAATTDSTEDADGFVDYKNRKNIALTATAGVEVVTGLIIRKRKQEDKSEEDDDSKEKQAEVMAQDAVALLLKHSVGHHVNEEDKELSKQEENNQGSGQSKTKKKKKTAKKVVGPDKPEYLDETIDYDSWVPPAGQSGDGRTSLNDRLGY
ncbi:putative transcription factor interactor and regulator FHA-SMAD family [Arabidopsis thaliana]